VVGLIDTALAAHPWLAGAATSPPDDMLKVVTEERPNAAAGEYPNLAAGHATFVAGQILRKAPACVVNVREVLDTDGKCTAWQLATEIVKMAKSKPAVINLSLICYTEDAKPPLVLATAIERIGMETVVVAAAGNHGDAKLPDPPVTYREEHDDTPQKGSPAGQARAAADALAAAEDRYHRQPGFPAALDGVIAVGSGTGPGKPAKFTPRGVGWIDVLTDGDGVTSTFPAGFFSKVADDQYGQPQTTVEQSREYARWGGSSFAAAKVSGAIAAEVKPGKVSPREAVAKLMARAVPAPAPPSVSGSDATPQDAPFLPL
jgi:membrane-anchored mycosin MYCP